MSTKIRHKRWTNQLLKALLAKGQTWDRDDATKDSWAEDFALLESEVGRERLERCLNWYCKDGCGALFVPLIGNAETFRCKFEQLDAARKRLRGKPLQYFDDILDYKIQSRRTGSKVQRQHARVMQKMQQRVQFIDDLAHGRAKLPPIRPTFKIHKPKQRPYSPFLAKARKRWNEEQREQLDKLLEVDRDVMWKLLMENPTNQAAFHNHLEKVGFWNPFADLVEKATRELKKEQRRQLLELQEA